MLGGKEQKASSNVVTSLRATLTPRTDNPTPVVDDTNIWCNEGQLKVYREAKMINAKRVMTQLVNEEHRVFTGSLHINLEIHSLFHIHKCAWMGPDMGA